MAFLLLNHSRLRQAGVHAHPDCHRHRRGGHIAAAAALEEAWRALRPDDVVERLDIIKFFSPLHKKSTRTAM